MPTPAPGGPAMPALPDVVLFCRLQLLAFIRKMPVRFSELVLFAMGFSGPADGGVLSGLALQEVARGRFKGVDASERDYRLPGNGKLFAAGDVRRGQSLVVWAIREGRQAASSIDKYLMGKTTLPR